MTRMDCVTVAFTPWSRSAPDNVRTKLAMSSTMLTQRFLPRTANHGTSGQLKANDLPSEQPARERLTVKYQTEICHQCCVTPVRGWTSTTPCTATQRLSGICTTVDTVCTRQRALPSRPSAEDRRRLRLERVLLQSKNASTSPETKALNMSPCPPQGVRLIRKLHPRLNLTPGKCISAPS